MTQETSTLSELVALDPDWALGEFERNFPDLYYRLLPAHLGALLGTADQILTTASAERVPAFRVIVDLLRAEYQRGLSTSSPEVLAAMSRAVSFMIMNTPVMRDGKGTVRDAYAKSVEAVVKGAESFIRANQPELQEKFNGYLRSLDEHRQEAAKVAETAQKQAARLFSTRSRYSRVSADLATDTKAAILLREANKTNSGRSADETNFLVVALPPGGEPLILPIIELTLENDAMGKNGYIVVQRYQGALAATNLGDFTRLVREALPPSRWKDYIDDFKRNAEFGIAVSPKSEASLKMLTGAAATAAVQASATTSASATSSSAVSSPLSRTSPPKRLSIFDSRPQPQPQSFAVSRPPTRVQSLEDEEENAAWYAEHFFEDGVGSDEEEVTLGPGFAGEGEEDEEGEEGEEEDGISEDLE